jgi:hypothetical protein
LIDVAFAGLTRFGIDIHPMWLLGQATRAAFLGCLRTGARIDSRKMLLTAVGRVVAMALIAMSVFNCARIMDEALRGFGRHWMHRDEAQPLQANNDNVEDGTMTMDLTGTTFTIRVPLGTAVDVSIALNGAIKIQLNKLALA